MSTAYFRQLAPLFDYHYWYTAVMIAKNSLARLYRNSFLGMIWTVLQPLSMVIVYAAIMPLILRFPKGGNYPLYIIVSLPLWGFCSLSLINSSQSILSNAPTIMRCTLSATVFPVADLLRSTYTFFISFMTMYIVALLLRVTTFSPIVLLGFIYVVPILMTLGALAIAISFIAPYLRDIGDLMTIAMAVLFWLTPVVYPLSALPEHAQQWMQWNPFFILMRPMQMLIYENVVPGTRETFHLLALTITAILVGLAIFRACRRNYVYYL
jgi:lipopolysaccharide transport system permease protein